MRLLTRKHEAKPVEGMLVRTGRITCHPRGHDAGWLGRESSGVRVVDVLVWFLVTHLWLSDECCYLVTSN